MKPTLGNWVVMIDVLKETPITSLSSGSNVRLERDFGFDDDASMASLERSLEELKKSKLDYAGTPPPNEMPKRPFGTFTEPTFERKTGRRSEFSTVERVTRENVVLRRETAVSNATGGPSNGHHRDSRISTGEGGGGLGGKSVQICTFDSSAALRGVQTLQLHRALQLGGDWEGGLLSVACGGSLMPSYPRTPPSSTPNQMFPHPSQVLQATPSKPSPLSCSKFSFDPSIDDGSSLVDGQHSGSRRSLADTSVTSTADLSVFSRSQALDNSMDTHSNASDASSGGSGGHCGSIQRGPSAHSTPRVTPHAPSPDIVRIYVPSPPPQNGDIPRSLPRPFSDQNKIRIRIDTQEDQTPVVEQGHIIRLDSPELDLK
uniref:Uncharacterized protein n=1 Tax=Timema shepardi TaxID=629360 RepID=A0A7R9AM05_TIMSH|nr:unnamed protein product [Timema shepardi]